MTQPNAATPSATLRRGRVKLLGIVSVVMLPLLGAAIMAHYRIGIPDDLNNKSSLLEPARQAADWQLELTPLGYGAPWRLLVTHSGDCLQDCQALLHQARQIHVALGREAERVEHVLASASALPETTAATLRRGFPRLQQSAFDQSAYLQSLQAFPSAWRSGPQLWLLDPLGRIVLHHEQEQPGKYLLDDLKRLLKMSKVG